MNSEAQVIHALFAAEVSEERILGALPPLQARRIAAQIADDAAIRRDKSFTEQELALGEADQLEAGLSIRTRILVARAMLRKYRQGDWLHCTHPALYAFQARLSATLDSERDRTALWDCVQTLAGFHPRGRDSGMWKTILASCERQLQLHALVRKSALNTADVMAALTDEGLEAYLYNREGHCKECAIIALSKVPQERLAPIWAAVRHLHFQEEEEEREARMSRC